MRILWVKAGGLVPLDSGGKIRSFHIARELARHHQVTLFTFYAEHPNDQHSTLANVFERVEAMPLRVGSGRGIVEALGYATNFFSPLPHSITKYSTRTVSDALARLVEREHYDVILCDFIFAAKVVPWKSAARKVLFTHNVEAMIWKRHAEVTKNPWRRSVYAREYKRMLWAEKNYLSLADHVLTVSDVDRQYFSDLVDASKITTIPTGVDTDFFTPQPGQERPHRLVFTGSMDWMPNEDGMLYFCTEILPRIWQHCPDTEVYIVGRSPTAKVQALTGDPRIKVTGRVDDVRPHIAAGAVYFVPLRVGSGTRLKIFEAMAMRKAVVSTTIGAEGLPVKRGENILLADTPDAFASCVVTLLQDQAQRVNLGAAARKMVEENFSWAAVSMCFAAAIESVTRGVTASGK
jgi:polysaccharide biosynthesis protein PslH